MDPDRGVSVTVSVNVGIITAWDKKGCLPDSLWLPSTSSLVAVAERQGTAMYYFFPASDNTRLPGWNKIYGNISNI